MQQNHNKKKSGMGLLIASTSGAEPSGTQQWCMDSTLGRTAGGSEPDTNGVGRQRIIDVPSMIVIPGGGLFSPGVSCGLNCRIHTGTTPVRGGFRYQGEIYAFRPSSTRRCSDAGQRH